MSTKTQTRPSRLRNPRLLGEASRNPDLVLDDRRCRKPDFCLAFLDVCDAEILTKPSKGLAYAENAVVLAEKICEADRGESSCLVHRAKGVKAHAQISCKEWDDAEATLAEYEESALACCSPCKSDFYYRRADLRVETRKISEAEADMERSVAELGGNADENTLGRRRFVRGIIHHFSYDPEAAIDDAGRALLELALDASRGHFLDAVALLAVFLKRSLDPSHDDKAMDYLDRFEARIKGARDFTHVRTLVRWVRGGIHARRGEIEPARKKLETVREAKFKSGPVRHAVAVALDEGQLLARRLHENNLVPLRTLISMCLRELDFSQDEWLQRRLKKVKRILEERPENAARVIHKLRHSFVVPVPGLV